MSIQTTKAVTWTQPWGSALPPPVEHDEYCFTSNDESATNATSTKKQCPICASFVEVVLEMTDCCAQELCQTCMATWFVHHSRAPKCPFCLTKIKRQTLVERLRMDPPLAEQKTPNGEQSTDMLTQNWLDEEMLHRQGAKACPHCGYWIIKNGGCEHMTCLCGEEFCWQCLRPMWECDGECTVTSSDEDIGEESGEASVFVDSDVESDEVDDRESEGMLQRQGAKACPHCGFWITDDGCEQMTCLCGEEFCWYCVRLMLECNCKQTLTRCDEDVMKKVTELDGG